MLSSNHNVRDCITVGENTWPAELTPLTSPCLLLNTLSSVLSIPAKAPGNASGLGTCLLLYFYILDAEITFQFNAEPFHSNLHRTRPRPTARCSGCLPRWGHLSPARLASDTTSFAPTLQEPQEVFVGTSNTAVLIQGKAPVSPRRPQVPGVCPTMQLFGTEQNPL